MPQNKKPTKADIERRMRNAVVMIPRDKDYQSVYFDDKGLRLELTQDYAIITTGYHRHVFSSFTAGGVSRPYLYTKRLIEIANTNDCMVEDNNGNKIRSYVRLMAVLQEKENKSEYQIVWYVDLWLSNIFAPLYSIGESMAESFIVYEQYIHNIARNQTILSEKAEGMTNKEYINGIIELIHKFTDDLDEQVMYPKKSEEEKNAENADAMQQHEQEKAIEEVANGNGVD
jgi:hypothetical protein